MQQQISVITLGIKDRRTSRRFYVDGFGWSPIFENAEIIFYQMNGLVLGTWHKQSLLDDMNHPAPRSSTGDSFTPSCALAHNVAGKDDVKSTMQRLIDAGGTLLRPADAPVHGGFRGYVADPDGHAWEIAWNAAWAIDERGLVTFGV